MDEKKGNLKKMLSWSDSSDSDSDEEEGIKKGTSIVWVCNLNSFKNYSQSWKFIHNLGLWYLCKGRLLSKKRRNTF